MVEFGRIFFYKKDFNHFLFFLPVNYDEPPVIADPWNIHIPEDQNCLIQTESGVIQVYKSAEDLKEGRRKCLAKFLLS